MICKKDFIFKFRKTFPLRPRVPYQIRFGSSDGRWCALSLKCILKNFFKCLISSALRLCTPEYCFVKPNLQNCYHSSKHTLNSNSFQRRREQLQCISSCAVPRRCRAGGGGLPSVSSATRPARENYRRGVPVTRHWDSQSLCVCEL